MLFYTVTVTICFLLQRTTLFRGFTNLMTAQVHNNKTPKTAKDNYSISTFEFANQEQENDENTKI